MEIRPILVVTPAQQDRAAAGRHPGRAEPRHPRQRAVHREPAACLVSAPVRPRRRGEHDHHHGAPSEAAAASGSLAQQKRDVEILRRVARRPAATWISQMPMSRSGSNSGFALDRKQTRQSIILSTYFAPPGAVDALGLKLVEGRDFTPDDVVEFDAENDTPSQDVATLDHHHQGRGRAALSRRQRGRQDPLLRHRRRRRPRCASSASSSACSRRRREAGPRASIRRSPARS